MAALRHTDTAAHARRREATYQQLCADIMREARDMEALRRAESRALSHSDAANDPELAAMVRAFVAERMAELLAQRREREAEEERAAAPHPAEPRLPAAALAPEAAAEPARKELTPAQVRERAGKLYSLLHEHLIHFDEREARSAYVALRELHERYPALVDAGRLAQAERDLNRASERWHGFLKHVEQLADKAAAAAERGDHMQAARALRRLSSIHAARPALLPDAQFEQVRQRILSASERHEHRQAAAELLRRERAVAAEIRKLADCIHRFHRVCREMPHDHADYVRAEQEYLSAVREVRSHDAEWLAGLILELEDLVGEWHGPAGVGEEQLDRFLTSVRGALAKLRKEIQQIEQERAH